jgi:hypothetical protein
MMRIRCHGVSRTLAIVLAILLSLSFIDFTRALLPALTRPPHSTRLGVLESFESFLLGTTFGEEEFEKEEEDPEKELARFPTLATGEDTSVARNSLESFLRQWAVLLENDSSLATPVNSAPFVTINSRDKAEFTDSADAKSSSMKLMFRPPKRYLSYSEQKNLEKGVLPDRKGAKVDAWSPGGIEIFIQTVASSEGKVVELCLVAKRCGIDGDTIIKETSERKIVRRLNEAVRVWKKVRRKE